MICISRLTSLLLQQHPWLAGVETDSIDIAEWVSNISKMPTPSPQQ